MTRIRCANVGDEIGGFLVSYLSGGHPVEHVGIREMMDVVVVGSVLNYVMSSSNVNTHKMGGRYNVSVWGAGTKPFRTSKDYLRKLPCFDFRAVSVDLSQEKHSSKLDAKPLRFMVTLHCCYHIFMTLDQESNLIPSLIYVSFRIYKIIE